MDVGSSAVHVWRLALKTSRSNLGSQRTILSSDEIQRANRFRFETDRNRYIAARCGMRSVLAAYLDRSPAELKFSYTAMGKPELAGDSGNAGLHFNLSHSANLALLAVTRAGGVGIDIEQVKLGVPVDELSSLLFTSAEQEWLQSLQAEEKLRRFYTCWTRKEAFSKAQGIGLNMDPQSFEVVSDFSGPSHAIKFLTLAEPPFPWRIYGITVSPEWVASLVVQGHHHDVVQKEWLQSV